MIPLDDDHALEVFNEPVPLVTYEREMHVSFDGTQPGLIVKEGSRYTMLPVGSSGREPKVKALVEFFRRELLPKN